MSFLVTLLLVVCSGLATVGTLMSVRSFNANDAFYGLILSFVSAVATAFYCDFADPNSWQAVRFALLTAVVAPMVWMTVVHIGALLVQRAKR